MFRKNIRILGTGSYLPKDRVSHTKLEKDLGLEKGWIMDNCGVKTRYRANNEEASSMGAKAALKALERSGLGIKDIDVIMGVSGIDQQAIPSMAALIHKKLGMKKTYAFDINSTCLSFLSGLDLASELIHSGKYQNILIVSADIASVGLNPNEPKTASLFGDGAAAVVAGPSRNTHSHIKISSFETWTEEQDACLFEGGGSKLYLKKIPQDQSDRLYFKMQGPRLFKITIPLALKMLKVLLKKTKLSIHDLVFIPHQASPKALELFQKKLGIFSENIVNIVQDYGNMIATSIPFALDYAISNGMLKRGDNCLFLGTSAGLSVGGMIIEY